MRYLRLYWHFVKFSFSKALQFRIDFSFRIIMDLIYYVVQFSFFNVIFLHTDVLAGWNLDQLRIFVASYIFIDALHMTVFANNCWWLPIYINRGTLDTYITKPVSSLFFLSLRDFSANSFVNLLMAIGILIWSFVSYPTEFGLGQLLIYIGLLLNGTFLYFCLHALFLLSVFWTESPRGFGDVFFAVAHIYERPHKIFIGPFRLIVTYILPFTLCASYPASFLFDDNGNEALLTIFIGTLTTFLVLLFVWNRGLRSYSSASS
jgi:ABC-2 type transport system permease protein